MTSGMIDPVTGTEAVPRDGRLARGARTRAAVIDALLALHEEGELAPTAQRVAARAGVSLRTVYGHFADMERLSAQAADREFARMVALSRDPDPALPYPERLRAFTANRATVLEWLLPVMRAGAVREHESPALRRSRRKFVAAGDVALRTALAPELAALSGEAQERLAHLVHLVAGGPAWLALRQDRGLDPEQAGELLHEAVTAVLRDALAGGPGPAGTVDRPPQEESA